jgi:hypothetical protein
MPKLTRFEIRGLFGSRNIDMDLDGPALILVGPNGLGKSNAASIFYLFTTRQWSRLLDHSFNSIVAHFENDSYELSRNDILGISEISDLLSDRRLSPRLRENMHRLQESGELEYFFLSKSLSPLDRKKFASILQTSSVDIVRMQAYLKSRLTVSDDLISPSRAAISEILSSEFGQRTIYLPTYRRIEKELKQIFPDFEERVRSAELSGRTPSPADGAHYVDLVSFGMEDVKAAIRSRLEYLRNYSLAQFNSLSGTYLRDVIRGKATDFKMSQIRSLNDETVNNILSRVSEITLSQSDKELLKTRMALIRSSRRKSDIDLNDQYLVHYFSRLMDVYDDIRSKEEEVIAFVEVCNDYLGPSKNMYFDDISFDVRVVDEQERPLDLSHLSSGEKQVVSLFAHLYLEGSDKNTIIIDEPELSLSVPWQKRFLPDILDSKRCQFILAVTHSPFIYQNRLRPYTRDFRSLMSTDD